MQKMALKKQKSYRNEEIEAVLTKENPCLIAYFVNSENLQDSTIVAAYLRNR
jgi:hypothetical protein